MEYDSLSRCLGGEMVDTGSRNIGDLLYLMNEESSLKSSALHPPLEYMLQQESPKGRLETSGKMPARNPTDKVHYIVQGLETHLLSDFGTGRSQNGDYRAKSHFASHLRDSGRGEGIIEKYHLCRSPVVCIRVLGGTITSHNRCINDGSAGLRDQ
ncbi:hypothetical protein HAX54_022391 [Datura stramonium]|uniref:Uncharacterized protein n=1 Tax=Datura stramonium TaxID=4076 RepID=A0ABS8UU65_DATST|nr:hypothetical protein [Datura stramonium]